MIGINWPRTAARRLLTVFAAAVLVIGLAGCGSGNPEFSSSSNKSAAAPTQIERISEVSPPEAVQQLRQTLEIYQPQVSILEPKPDAVLADTDISVRLQVKDLPVFQDASSGLGPHLQVFLDNKPYQAVYDTSQPLAIAGLEPGTHTLRVFASRPWEESFKNDGAYAQTTFHIFTKTPDNNPDRTLPQLTYNQPQDSYGAEPILLDFYLTNAPLHSAAQANSQDEILDWKIRATVNGESFAIDQWQPIYLKGFKPGKNWVQLELIDEAGNLIKNPFNNTVRLINYQPQGQDALSKLVRGSLTAAETRAIVDRTYQAPKPKPTPTPEPQPTPALKTPIVKPSPAVPETPAAKPSQEPKIAPEVKPIKATEPKPTATPEIETPKVVEPIKETEPKPTATPALETPKVVEPIPATEPKPTATPALETPKVVEPIPATEPKPTATPAPIETPKIAEPIKIIEPTSPSILETAKQKTGALMNRFRSFMNQATEPKTSAPKLQPTPPATTKPSTELTVPETPISEPENPPKSEQKVEFTT